MIDAIHSGQLQDAPVIRDDIFGFDVLTHCPGVPSGICVPRETWSSQHAYLSAASKLAARFRQNFTKYAEGVSPQVLAAGPRELESGSAF
ncbi:MAG: hypothetical protein R3C12_02110 [Planctomycetaceae bacterium]